MQYASNYDLLVSIINEIETGNIMKIRELKRNTKLTMENLEHQSWEASVLLYCGMNVYRDVYREVHGFGGNLVGRNKCLPSIVN